MSTVAEKTAARSPGPLYHVSVHTFHIFYTLSLTHCPLLSQLPSTITKRTCGFGFGERFPLRNIVTDSPGPGSYEVMPAPSRTLLDVASNLSVHRRIR